MDNTALFFTIFHLAHTSPILDSLMVFGAEYIIYLTVTLVILLFFKGGPQEKKVVVLIILALGFFYIIEKLIHLFYNNPRPFVTYPIQTLIKHPATPSFPSTHTSSMAIIAFSYYFYKSKYFPIFLSLMLWIGLARVFVGVHYPLDILGGVITGFLAVLLAWQLKNFLKKQFIT